MSTQREFDPGRYRRVALVLGALAAALVVSPNAVAGVQFGISVNIPLPPGVHVSVGNYEPYYVGRVYYPPVGAWRPVYSFPLETPYGVVYRPYVYDAGRVVCHGYIPGPETGYGAFVIEGHGYYNPRWYSGPRYNGYHGGHVAYYDPGPAWHPHGAYRPDGNGHYEHGGPHGDDHGHGGRGVHHGDGHRH